MWRNFMSIEAVKIQLQVEIDWLKAKLQTKLKPRHKKQLEHQIKKKEYDLALGKFPNYAI